jgi:hypothetical protein
LTVARSTDSGSLVPSRTAGGLRSAKAPWSRRVTLADQALVVRDLERAFPRQTAPDLRIDARARLSRAGDLPRLAAFRVKAGDAGWHINVKLICHVSQRHGQHTEIST